MRTLIRSLALLAIFAACNPGDDDLPVPTSWTALGQHAKEALLSVSGRSERDVFAVGADRGAGPLVLHYDGETWQRMSTGSRGDLWWVHAFADGPVFMAGAYATILKHEGDTFTRMKTPGIGVNTIYGLWGPAPDDLYAVGSITGRNGFIWHYDGKEWKDLPLPADLPLTDKHDIPGFFKVWGQSGDSVYVVGGKGVMLHGNARDGFKVVPTAADVSLFTVHGRIAYGEANLDWGTTDADQGLTNLMMQGARVLIRVHCGLLGDTDKRVFSSSLRSIVPWDAPPLPGGIFESWFHVNRG